MDQTNVFTSQIQMYYFRETPIFNIRITSNQPNSSRDNFPRV